ncbi:HAD family hydrolase [Paenibacillus sp. GYB004]|uniref:HAD family hydrolase n=1 Tax=Paenibacillus sp. GYB004 TaxID=2994393 RepID=UPI002F961FA8
MNPGLPYEAIIFDMDNTLLKSSINFPQIKSEVFALLCKEQLLPPGFPVGDHTIATLIETARNTPGMTPALDQTVWEIVVEGERAGMAGAGLEPNVTEVLERLHGRYPLTVLTNNAYQAALEALERTGIIRFFDHIAGREQMDALKPSSSGVAALLAHYPHIRPEKWLSVGDSWIDGKAAQGGGVAFLAYNAKVAELARREVPSIGHIQSMRELLGYLE